MQLQQFLFKRIKTRGPMGVFEETRVAPMGSGPINHKGHLYEIDANGWCEVPHLEAMELKTMVFARDDGGVVRYCTPDEVDENLRLGLMEQGKVHGPSQAPRPAEEPARQRTRTSPPKQSDEEIPEIADDGGRPDDDVAVAFIAGSKD